MPIQPADYALRVLGIDTPAADLPTVSDRGRPKLIANLETIKTTPGVWCAVATYRTPKGAVAVLEACREDKQKTPGDFYMMARRYTHQDGTVGSELLAMYPGEETPEAPQEEAE